MINSSNLDSYRYYTKLTHKILSHDFLSLICTNVSPWATQLSWKWFLTKRERIKECADYSQWQQKNFTQFGKESIYNLYLFKSSFSTLCTANKKRSYYKGNVELEIIHFGTSILLMSNFLDHRHKVDKQITFLKLFIKIDILCVPEVAWKFLCHKYSFISR